MVTDARRPFEIRAERAGDVQAVRRVVEAAFKGKVEADLVDALREGGKFSVALVAAQGRTIAGFCLLTDVEVEGAGLKPRGAGLAPLAVRPTFQRRGIGGMLLRAALERAREAGYGFVVLLGDPRYYRRFGFRAGATLGLACEFAAPEEAFMAIELALGALAGVSGTVRYLPEFAESFA
ncbi:MAG TPA: N-acetyltransferase [Burkholderiales bacterium]|nr:N-acetyltransferase [Burkholderiales bacterium]